MRAFVTVHDAILVPECAQRFAELDPTFLFVGPRQPPYGWDVIHCAAHTPNVERLRQFYDFTGWYVLADLIRTGEVTDSELFLLHYDMKLLEPTEVVMSRTSSMLATPGPVSFEAGDPVDWMSPADPTFTERYREAMAERDVNSDELSPVDWPTTQGMAWRSSEFVEFVDWFTPLFDAFADHPLAGHLAERTINAWCHHTGRPARIARGLVWHDRLDSHGTTALFYGRRREHRRKAAAFNS